MSDIRALEEGGRGFRIQSFKQARDSRFKFQTGQDSRFKFQTDRDSRFKINTPVLGKSPFQFSGIQISKYLSGIHFHTEAEIQDSNLNPKKMGGIQDSYLVFKGPHVAFRKAKSYLRKVSLHPIIHTKQN